MSQEMPETDAELAFFITEGNYRLATIASNDYGFQLSAMMAQTYLAKAVDLLESTRTPDFAAAANIGKLTATAAALGDEYAQLEHFCSDCQRFNRLQTKNLIEWISKWAVRAISHSYLVNDSHYLAYKIRSFHAMACSALLEKERR
jgi:hypothetical protein